MVPQSSGLARPQIQAMMAHAARAYPRECCGIITHHEGELLVVPAANLSSDQDRFLLDPRALVAVRKEGRPIVGFYHSHPDGPATLSKRDRLNLCIEGEPSWPDVEYWVLSTCAGQTVDLGRFVWNPSRRTFEEQGHGYCPQRENR